MPRESAFAHGQLTDQGAAVEPEHMLHVGSGARVERDRFLRRRPSQRIADAAQRRRNPRTFRRILARARRQHRRHPARHAGLPEQLQHVRRPVLVDLELRAGGVGRTQRPAGLRIDADGPMELADADRRLAGDVPGLDGARAIDVGQISAGGADRDFAYARRRDQGRQLGRLSAGEILLALLRATPKGWPCAYGFSTNRCRPPLKFPLPASQRGRRNRPQYGHPTVGLRMSRYSIKTGRRGRLCCTRSG